MTGLLARYNPWRDLGARAQLTLIFGKPDMDGAVSQYDPGTGEVTVDRSRSYEERRCDLAHELAHVDRGDVGHDPDNPDSWRFEARDEEATDRLAARRLITLDALVDAMAPGHDWFRVAAELDVDTHTLFARLRGLTDQERAYVWGALDEREAGLPWA